MLHLISTTDESCYISAVFLYLVCEIPQQGTDAPKHVVVKVHTLKCVCNLCNKLVL